MPVVTLVRGFCHKLPQQRLVLSNDGGVMCCRASVFLVVFPHTSLHSLFALRYDTGIRTGRCPAIRKREDCPTYVWDDCTCDLDCLDLKKCCFDGCRHACLEAGKKHPTLVASPAGFLAFLTFRFVGCQCP